DIDWRRYRRLAPLIVVGSVPGALLVGAADRSWLEVIIGAALLATLITTALVHIPPVSGLLPAAVAGPAGGFLNTAVGVAAPAMLVYAQATGWTQRSFAAALQPIFCTMGAISVIAKVGLGAAPVSGLPPATLIALVVAMVPVGILVGSPIARRVPAQVGQRIAVVVVTAGALVLLGRGLAGAVELFCRCRDPVDRAPFPAAGAPTRRPLRLRSRDTSATVGPWHARARRPPWRSTARRCRSPTPT